VAPLIGAHAARLEQVPESMFLTDPETQARCLRNCQALYATDAVTIGAGADTLAIAARLAAEPGCDALTARAAVRQSLAPATLPEPDAVIGQSVIRAETGAIERLRPVLGERAGIAVVFADSQSLARQLGDAGAAPWCAALLLRAVRLYCELEPDLVITVGGGGGGGEPRLGAVCDHFGAGYIHLGATEGVIAPPRAEFISALGEGASGWLYTTSSEIPAATDPGEMQAAIAGLRARTGEGKP
jgi:hypothetical protein